MKGLLRGLLAIAVMVIGYGALAVYVPAVRIAPVCAPAEAFLINHGLIKVQSADWGYLKLRAGKNGLKALTDIEHNGPPEAARASVAVQEQWFEAGHAFDDPFNARPVQEKETQFKDLWLPDDGKLLPRTLASGQTIPDDFWRDQRFRLDCQRPPQKVTTRFECILRMADLDGDGQAEVIFDRQVTGTMEYYVRPIVRHRWRIYAGKGNIWDEKAGLQFCVVEQAAISSTLPVVSKKRVDMIWFNGQAVNFFNEDCYGDNSTRAPAQDLTAASAMASRLKDVPVLAGTWPASLAEALARKAIMLPAEGEPLGGARTDSPRFAGLPPCFVSANPKACVAIVADIDRDGSEDVIILDRDVKHEVVDYRIATLLMVRGGHWQVISNHAVCAKKADVLEKTEFTLKPAKWLPVEFAGKRYLPAEETDICIDHGYHM